MLRPFGKCAVRHCISILHPVIPDAGLIARQLCDHTHTNAAGRRLCFCRLFWFELLVADPEFVATVAHQVAQVADA